MKPSHAALALACLLSTAASSKPAKPAGSAAAPAIRTVCGSVRVNVVQCIRAPCPPLVFLTQDGTKEEFSLHGSPRHQKAMESVRHGAHLCVTGQVSGVQGESLTVLRAVAKPVQQ
jgi:hypothetical protein